jgi:hypothetical protein
MKINKKIVKCINDTFHLKNKSSLLLNSIEEYYFQSKMYNEVSQMYYSNTYNHIPAAINNFVDIFLEKVNCTEIIELLDYKNTLKTLYQNQYRSKLIIDTFKNQKEYKIIEFLKQIKEIDYLIAEKTCLIELYYLKYI